MNSVKEMRNSLARMISLAVMHRGYVKKVN